MPQTLTPFEEYALKFYPKKKPVLPAIPESRPTEPPKYPQMTSLGGRAEDIPLPGKKKYDFGKAVVGDIVGLGKGIVEISKLGSAVMRDPGLVYNKDYQKVALGIPKAVVQSYGELIKHPVKTLMERPVTTFLDVAPVAGGLFKGVRAVSKTAKFVKTAKVAKAAEEMSDWNQIFKHSAGFIEKADDVSPARIMVEGIATPENPALAEMAKSTVPAKDFIEAAHQSLSKTKPGWFKIFREYYGSPYEVFKNDRVGQKLWNFSDRQDLNRSRWLENIFDTAQRARQGLILGKEGKLARAAHAKLRNDGIRIPDAVKMKDTELSVFYKLTPDEIGAFRAKAGDVLKYDQFLDKAYPTILRQWGKSKVGGAREREFWELTKTKPEPVPTPGTVVPKPGTPVEQAAQVAVDITRPPTLPGAPSRVTISELFSPEQRLEIESAIKMAGGDIPPNLTIVPVTTQVLKQSGFPTTIHGLTAPTKAGGKRVIMMNVDKPFTAEHIFHELRHPFESGEEATFLSAARAYPTGKQAESIKLKQEFDDIVSGHEKNLDAILRKLDESKSPTKISPAVSQAQDAVRSIVSPAEMPKVPPGSDDWVKGLTAPEKEVFDLYSRKQDRYLTHVIDRKDYLDILRAELSRITQKISASSKTKSRERLGIYAQELKEKLAAVESGSPILYQDVPGKVFNRFFQPRTANLDIWQKDTSRAFDSYIHSLAKKMFDEPVAELYKSSYADMSPGIRKYATWYMRRYMGMEKGPLTPLMNKIKEIQWVRTLGGSTRSAVTNLSQRFNTLAVAPKDAIQGYAMGFTRAGKELFDKSGLPSAVPGALMNVAGDIQKFRTAVTLRDHLGSGWDTIRELSGIAFKKAEIGNQKHAFLAGYRRAKRTGATDPAAMQSGIDLARQTQFRYGRTGTAKLLTSGGGVAGTALQFWSYPMKQLEFLVNLAKKEPGKLLLWWGMTEGTNYAVGELLGLDMSGSLGLGINYSQVLEGLQDLSDGDIARMKFHLKQSKLPFISGEKGGLFPQGMGPIADTISRTAKAFNGDTDFIEILGGVEPLQSIRYRQMIRSIMQEKPDETGMYTIKAPYGGAPLYKESRGDIVARTFIAKPLAETQDQQERKEIQAASRMETVIQRKIAKLVMAEKWDEAEALMAKYEIPPEDIDATIRAAQERREKTPGERAKKGQTWERQLETWRK